MYPYSPSWGVTLLLQYYCVLHYCYNVMVCYTTVTMLWCVTLLLQYYGVLHYWYNIMVCYTTVTIL